MMNLKIIILCLPVILLPLNRNTPSIDGKVIRTGQGTQPVIKGVHTLSIHVRDTITHDSVFHFLVNRLALPVYYFPEQYGFRKYAGIYAGNMVLEPCGPYPDTRYATGRFRSMFYGMNFEVPGSLESSEKALGEMGIEQQVNQGSIYIRDTALTDENIFAALYEVRDKSFRDSLRSVLTSDMDLKPGIEYIKEIVIGFKAELNLTKWKQLLYPRVIGDSGVCHLNDSLQLHFIKGDINEVKGITFKVVSIEKAMQYLDETALFESLEGRRIRLNESETFGLRIDLTDLD